MNNLPKNERSKFLNAYLDRELTDEQSREVEELAARNPEVQQELEELRNLKRLLASRRVLPPSVGFWTRLSAELDRREREEDNLLPFPRKYVPIITTVAAVLVVAVGVVLYEQRKDLAEYVSQQTERMQKAVEDNVLKGSILPLFSQVDKNQALQFAMFGTIPLDPKAETELKVDEDSAKGYTINVNKAGAARTPAVTVKDFVEEVRPTRVQLQIIDSLLDLGRQKLEGSVFVAEDKAMAVHPELSRLNKVMLSGIAAALEPEQRTRFNRFLQERRAPYTLTGGQRTPASMDRILHTLRLPQQSDQYVVVTPETVLVAGLKVDIDSVRKHFSVVANRHTSIAVHMDGLIRRIAEREASFGQHVSVPEPRVRVFGDIDVISIHIGSGWEGLSAGEPEMLVRPRAPMPGKMPRRSTGRSFNFNFSSEDSSFFFNVDLDSLMLHLSRDAEGAGLEFFRGDPRLRNRIYQTAPPQVKRITDSAVIATKRQWSKLDSLMREMENRDLQQRLKNQVPRNQQE